jgi:hypothetical protein
MPLGLREAANCEAPVQRWRRGGLHACCCTQLPYGHHGCYWLMSVGSQAGEVGAGRGQQRYFKMPCSSVAHGFEWSEAPLAHEHGCTLRHIE